MQEAPAENAEGTTGIPEPATKPAYLDCSVLSAQKRRIRAIARLSPDGERLLECGPPPRDLWLCDDTIDLVVERLVGRYMASDAASTLAERTTIWPAYLYGNAIKDKTLLDKFCDKEKVSYFTADTSGNYAFNTIMIPACVGGNHWILVAVFPARQIIRIFDSLRCTEGATNSRQLEILDIVQHREGVEREWLESKSEYTDWKFQVPTNLPRQKDTYNCGVFVLLTMAIMIQNPKKYVAPHYDMTKWRYWFASLLLE